MNNAGTVLMTIADMSVIQAEVEVDETDVPAVTIGQAAEVSIDAIPERTFKGRVTEIGNSPIQEGTGQAAGTQATNFKVVVVLDEGLPEGIRPGFTCTADITTAVRSEALAVPIQAVTVRNLVFDQAGKRVREPRDDEGRRRRREEDRTPVTEDDLLPGQTLEETEGVFVYRDGFAEFVPVEVGIAGERYFEVLSGLDEGDQVVTGPYNSVRQIADGDPIRLEDSDGEEDGGSGFRIRFGRG
jgi:HlyD family secretion protein